MCGVWVCVDVCVYVVCVCVGGGGGAYEVCVFGVREVCV